jgi:hypothetical protein
MNTSESPLLKVRQAVEDGHYWRTIVPLILDAEERWELERELHREQVKKIRKHRHEYILTLQKTIAELREELQAALRMEAGE